MDMDKLNHIIDVSLAIIVIAGLTVWLIGMM